MKIKYTQKSRCPKSPPIALAPSGYAPSLRIQFTRVSRNAKTGPIPVTTTQSFTCPTSCKFNSANEGGCYAAGGPLAILWRKLDNSEVGIGWQEALESIRKLPKGQLWRHNQAGDLPGQGDSLDIEALAQLVKANKGRNGFTYTHKPIADKATAKAIADSNRNGFTINLSANDLAHADQLADLGIAPVAVVLPSEQTSATQTPSGRKVAICPATISDNVTCASCGLCANAKRKAIIGFPAHGASKRKASNVAMGVN